MQTPLFGEGWAHKPLTERLGVINGRQLVRLEMRLCRAANRPFVPSTAIRAELWAALRQSSSRILVSSIYPDPASAKSKPSFSPYWDPFLLLWDLTRPQRALQELETPFIAAHAVGMAITY